MKRIISFVLIAAMVLMAAGCSGTTDGTAAETTAAATRAKPLLRPWRRRRLQLLTWSAISLSWALAEPA